MSRKSAGKLRQLGSAYFQNIFFENNFLHKKRYHVQRKKIQIFPPDFTLNCWVFCRTRTDYVSGTVGAEKHYFRSFFSFEWYIFLSIYFLYCIWIVLSRHFRFFRLLLVCPFEYFDFHSSELSLSSTSRSRDWTGSWWKTVILFMIFSAVVVRSVHRPMKWWLSRIHERLFWFSQVYQRQESNGAEWRVPIIRHNNPIT